MRGCCSGSGIANTHTHTHIGVYMRDINTGAGLTERKAFKHFGVELIIICQQESGLKYWGAWPPPEKYWGGLQPSQPSPSYAYEVLTDKASTVTLAAHER